ncbi:MAG TPA: hypothetical protein DCW68_07795 [Rhodospirillaceae bacterium]|nr:MAG: hypothetical protein A2018_07985 [Alphaproteobacteria bacterium GWF2_58_20]HAU29990.1 hypothetical protein [Rhodospirillaceae bacterium]
MTDLFPSPEGGAEHQRLGARVAAFMRMGAPLLVAAADARFWGDESPARSLQEEAALFSRMLESAVTIGRAAAERIGAWNRPGDDWARWTLASAAAGLVAAHYRATGKVLVASEAGPYLDAVAESAGIAGARADAPPEHGPGTMDVPLWVDMVRAMGPVVAAIARHAFAQDEEALAVRVLTHLRKGTGRAVDRILGDAPDPGGRATAFSAMMTLAGELYAECHYSEMERILALPEDERQAYADAEGEEESLVSVFRAFDARLSMVFVVAQAVRQQGGLS